MNSLLKRMSACLLALLIVISLLPLSTTASPAANDIITTPTGYTTASDVVYVKNGKLIANWGARGEDCVFLSTYAESYYAGEYSFDTMSALSGGNSQSNASSSALYSELQELMQSTHTFYTYYDGNKNVRQYYKYTDCVSSDTSKVALLYRGGLETSTWNSGNIWNQEHVWPQSKLVSSEQIGDIMHLRPANPSENSSRGNTAYGTGSGYYDPGVSVRGDCARMVLYMYVRWGRTSKMWGSSGVIQSVDILLQWMEEDPVDTWEMGRNDSVQSITGVRNVFVDYPEYAWLLFGRDVPENITTPSGNDGTTANPGGNNGGGGTTTTTPPTTQATTPPTTQATTPPTTQATTPPTTQATTPPSTQATTPPATQATTSPASQPSASEGTQAPKPSQPAPMATNSVAPPVLPKEDNTATTVIIIVAVVIALAAAGIIVYLVVNKRKKNAAPAEDTNPEEHTEDNE